LKHSSVLLTGSLLALAVGGFGCRSEPEPEARAASVVEPLAGLKAGFRHLAPLSPGQTRSFALPLQAGRYLHLVVEQFGVDVVATVRDAAGRRLLRVDNPNGASGFEEIFLVAGVSGRYVLSVEAWEGNAAEGRFAVRVEALRPAREEDRKRAAASGVVWQARLREREGSVQEAATGYREAARQWRALAEDAREAQALFWLGSLPGDDAARRRERIAIFSRALHLYRRLHEERDQALVLSHLGKAWLQADEVERASDCFEEAIALWQKLGDPEEQAARSNDLAIVRVRQGRIHAAIDLYSQAVEIWQKLGVWSSLATTRTNLGLLYASLGESRLALDHYHRALALLDQQPNPALRAVTLGKLGDVLLQTDGPEAALEKFREALELRRRRRDTRGQAVTLNSIGQAQLKANRPRKALRAFEAAVEIFRQHGEGSSVAVALNNLGTVYERLGQPGRARDLYRQALDLAVQTASPQEEEKALFGLARVARREGDLAESARRMEQSLDRIERIRSQVWRPDLRSSYHAARQEQYAWFIDLLAELHLREPTRGHAAQAFAIAERARARSLLDLLSAARHPPRSDELHHLDELKQRINDRHRKLLAMSFQGVASNELEGELIGLLESFRQAEVKEEGFRLAPQNLPPTLTLQQVQTRLLDEETLLLAYFFGEERSFLWAVTPSTVRFVTTLPGREQIEDAARLTSQRLTESHRQTGELAARQAAARLSQMVLGPVADLLTRRRLVVLAAGALQAVPFAALPFPTEQRPLLLDHEIVYLPSASVLGVLRSRMANRKQPPGLLAVVADPIPGPAGPGRLLFARQEAEAILSLAGTGRALAASGFAASRELVQSGRLRDYRTLHFATHGLLNDVHPELSALALSAMDASGRPVDGYLRAYEIPSLDLRADLAVLSACGTALGQEVGGEGLVGLTHGFLHAGVPRLVVSLWDVDDRATSELMKRFYAALLREKLSPAQALRQAQISLRAEERWRAPYYWAGFILQGEWRSSR
jgi:CHAT domain-containing protein/tetratricopeptide (TPR) repeat protein